MSLNFGSGLVEKARAGGAGLDALIIAVWPEAYRISFGILHDRGLAEDAAQEACASMARSLSGLKNTGVFRGWMYKIIVNHAITAARRQPAAPTPEAAAARSMSFDQSDTLDLRSALTTLPAVQRAAVLLHYYAGLNSAEIAAATSLPASTIRFHLMLARRALRKALSNTGFNTHASSEEIVSHVH